MSAAEEPVDVRELLDRDPESVIRQHRDVALELAQRHRERGEADLADEIERRVQLVEEGSR